MVAKAAWLTVEPEINLRAYLASGESPFSSPLLAWMPDEWTRSEEDFEIHCGGDEPVENG